MNDSTQDYEWIEAARDIFIEQNGQGLEKLERKMRERGYHDFLYEAAAFPVGTHDDQIDAISLAVELLHKRGGGFYAF